MNRVREIEKSWIKIYFGFYEGQSNYKQIFIALIFEKIMSILGTLQISKETFEKKTFVYLVLIQA